MLSIVFLTGLVTFSSRLLNIKKKIQRDQGVETSIFRCGREIDGVAAAAAAGKLVLISFLSHPMVVSYSSCLSSVQEQSARYRQKYGAHNG